jgi:hypothetical protein
MDHMFFLTFSFIVRLCYYGSFLDQIAAILLELARWPSQM